MAALRSKKYSRLDNSEILKLVRQQPTGESLHFLQVEIEQRNLQSEVEALLTENRKQDRHSIVYYLFYLFLLLLFLFSFTSNL